MIERKADITITEAQVISVIREVMALRSNSREIAPDTRIEDLDLSSLDQAEIVLCLGEMAGLDQIEADYAAEVVTVADLASLINALAAGTR